MFPAFKAIKKTLCLTLWIGLIALSARLFAEEVPYKYILIEDFTGSWCVNCPPAASAISKMKEEGKNIVAAGYHLNETGSTEYLFGMAAYERNLFYGPIYEVPSVFVNGQKVKPNYKAISHVYDSLSKLTTPYDIKMSVQHLRNKEALRDSFNVKVTITKLGTHQGDSPNIFLGLTQDNIQKKWFDQTEINHATRFMYPNGYGQKLEFGQSKEVLVSYNFSVPYRAQLPIFDANVLCFIQDTSSKHIYQTEILSLYAASAEIDPDFISSATDLAPEDSVTFMPNCSGSPQSYEWIFEGGKPSSSKLSNPTVFYDTIGTFPVTIKAIKDGNAYSYTRNVAINVLDVKPRISFSNPHIPARNSVSFSLESLSDSCIWTFQGGDPSLSNEKDITVKYATQDTFNVFLKTFYTSPSGKIFNYKKDFLKLVIVDNKFVDIEKEDISNSDFAIYREEGSRQFKIKSNEAWSHGEVYDLNGKRLFSFDSESFSVSNFPKGIYIVRIYAKSRIFAVKLLN